MIAGIMQPYFFPYPGYFSLIKATNQWVIFDTPQYANRSWMNRNRVIHPNGDGWIYLTVPIRKHGLHTPLNEIEIKNDFNWRERIISQLGYYKKRAPHFKMVVEFITDSLNINLTFLSELNVYTLQMICNYIGIDFNYMMFSDIESSTVPAKAADEWGLNISKAIGANQFINAEGGLQFVDRDKYFKNDIAIDFLIFSTPEYDQKRNNFIPRLSIIDAMMFNTASELKEMISNYRLV